MNDNRAVVESSGRRLSPVWVVPLVAVALGAWLAVDAYLDRGPVVTVTFSNASGIEQDKTRIKTRDVEVGIVTDVRLSDNLDGVVVTADLDPVAGSLLRDDTQFWVVRPTVKGANVSGLSTLLSGAYIEISPGVGPVSGKSVFRGLDRVPAAPAGTPGVRLKLISESSGSVVAGSPILYRGYNVGTVEGGELDVETRHVSYSIFIDAPYDRLVSTNTRFWDASGISAEFGADGIKVSMGSLMSTLVGGIAFDLPAGSAAGSPVTENLEFRLYPNELSIHNDPYVHYLDYVVLFDRSLRGLSPGAPVNYRGIRLGNVVQVMLREWAVEPGTAGDAQSLPVVIRMEPARMNYPDTPEGIELVRAMVRNAVANGLRATLETGNLLTGSLFVALDFYDDAEPARVDEFLDYPTIPAVSSGIVHLQTQLSELLEKLNELTVDETLVAAQNALTELSGTLTAARNVLEKDQTQQLTVNLQETLTRLNAVLAGYGADSDIHTEFNRTLGEIRATLQGIQGVTRQLQDKPNSIVFPSKPVKDPEPKAPRQ